MAQPQTAVAMSPAVTSTLVDSEVSTSLLDRLRAANKLVSAKVVGERPDRQPVHTVYGGAHLFAPDLAPKLGRVAHRLLTKHGGTALEFARAVGLSLEETLAETIYHRVASKLEREPVEDFRIDFEDGYGNRADDEEDGHAESAATALATAIREGTAPPFFGIRIKPLSDELAARSLRTLDRFVSTLARAHGSIPKTFVVTLPKITSVEHVSVLVSAFEALEKSLGLRNGSLVMEFMIETTQSLVGLDGIGNLTRMLDAANQRCVAAHFGTYDYTASCSITAAHQHMTHPSCDFARHMMQVAYAGRGIWLSDGATNIMPVPVHSEKGDATLTEEQERANRDQIHSAWKLHAEHIRHSLIHGYYQGWDLHPGHLPTRYAAVYSFFLEGLAAASERLSNFVAKAAQATLVGDVFDDAATGQGLLNFFLRGISCGAFPEDAALATGLTIDELRSRSFVKILENRR